jgi:hypothetical protein
VPRATRYAINTALGVGVPAQSIGFYARWWQLENWLRLLISIELGSAYGRTWTDHLGPQPSSRAIRDHTENAYMASPDGADPLAFLDVFQLFELIDSDEHWHRFEPFLPPRLRWRGTADELRQLRHRSAHCRRPHHDDLARLEQRMRDLEPGARDALRWYYRQETVGDRSTDPLLKKWRRHPTASRLVEHAWLQYHTSLRIAYSRRPWAPDTRQVTGSEGYLWHVRYQSHDDRWVTPKAFWSNSYLDIETKSGVATRDLVLHLVQTDPFGITVTLSAVDDPTSLADVIGHCFDAFLLAGVWSIPEDVWGVWDRGADELEPRVHVKTPLALAELVPDDYEFSIFGGR